MDDALIRCANGCGAALSFQRLREGRRGPRGVTCERCIADHHMRRLARWTDVPEAERETFIAKGVAWVMGDPYPDAGANHG